MSRYEMDKVIREVRDDEQAFGRYKADPTAYLAGRDLTDEERRALAQVDYPTLYRLGAHPFVLQGFVMKAWAGDRRALREEYREKIAPYGYPSWET